MTRLTQSHIEETRDHLADIDEGLQIRTRTDLKGVALRTTGIGEDEWKTMPLLRVAVVPITMGDGLIPGFTEALVAIARHIGFDADISLKNDVSGISEAFAEGGNIVMMADDDRFVAINIKSGGVADNDRSTGEGFATLLDMMAEGVRGRPCGVIGCGPVGTHAALRLAAMEGDLTVCVYDETHGRHLVTRLQEDRQVKAHWVASAAELLQRCPLVVEATPSGGVIPVEAIGPQSVITAPGVPLGLTPEAVGRIGSRCYHDNLPLGVATMLIEAGYGRMTEKGRP